MQWFDHSPVEFDLEIGKLWEYQQMFTAANLDTIAAQIDVGSAKFALRPRR